MKIITELDAQNYLADDLHNIDEPIYITFELHPKVVWNNSRRIRPAIEFTLRSEDKILATIEFPKDEIFSNTIKPYGGDDEKIVFKIARERTLAWATVMRESLLHLALQVIEDCRSKVDDD